MTSAAGATSADELKDRGDEQHTNDYSGPIRTFRQILAAGAIFN
jgi:hypothetical protein